MMVGVLRASSDYARANGAASGPDIFLLQEITHIGRNVPKSAGLPLPMTLAQVSGKHCQVIGNPHSVRRQCSTCLRPCCFVLRISKNEHSRQPCTTAFSAGVQGA